MLRSLKAPWAPPSAPQRIVLKNASLVDVKTSSIRKNVTITLAGGAVSKITEDGSSASESSASDATDSADQIVIDLEGKYVCPGLIDCHVHVTATPGALLIRDLYDRFPSTITLRASFILRKMLLRGFTTARDTGGCDRGIKDAVAGGVIPGPRLFIAGQALSQTGGHADFRSPHHGPSHKCCGDVPGLGRVCDGVPACLEATRDEFRKGADFIKIMCGGGIATLSDPIEMVQFTAEEIRAITTTARQFGTYVTAHAYTNESIRHAVDNGVTGIEHANLIDAETARYCAEKGVFVTPTLPTYQSWFMEPYSAALNADQKGKLENIMSHGKNALRILKDAGPELCYGSDLLGEAHRHQNLGLALMAESLTPGEVLQTATVNAAKLLRMEGKLGVVEEGALADLLILERNPLEDIAVLEKSDAFLAILKGGRVVPSRLGGMTVDDLYGAIQDN